jgi:hypothetical protein
MSVLRRRPPFTAEQYRSLLWLRARIIARDWLASHKLYTDYSHDDARLAFAKWLYATGRLNESGHRDGRP